MYLLQALQDACPNAPWALTFSYGRALQSSTLKVVFFPQCNRHLLNKQDAEVRSVKSSSGGLWSPCCAVQTWSGQAENKQAAQEILVKLAKANSEVWADNPSVACISHSFEAPSGLKP